MNENFYLLLELEFDPPVIDQAVIDQRIEEKAKFWSTNSNHFKKGPEYRMYLEKLPEIKRIMSDPVKREREADSACSIMYNPIDQDIKILGATGEITEDAIENYANAKKISVTLIKKRVSALGIKIIQKVDFQITYDKYYKNKPKNAEAFDVIKPYLNPFNKDDFYAFLNPGTLQNMDKLPCDKLKQLAQEKKKKEFYKNDTYSSAGKKVCEACELAFKDESSKTIYDDYLAWCKRRSILDNAKEISKITDKKMSDDQGDIYIGKLTELLKDRTLAENIFISFCKIEKIEYNPDLYNPGKKKEKARKEAEEKARKEAEEKVRKEAEEKVRKEAEEKVRKETEEKVRKEAKEKARKEAEKKAREEAEKKAKHDALKKLAIGAIICLLTLGGITLISGTHQSQPEISAPYQTVGERVGTNSSINGSEQPVLPVADFWSDITSGEAPLTVTFNDQSTGSPTSWDWNFGDGVTSTEKNPIHTYTTDGTYTVKETITNEIGKDTKESYITVTAPAEALTSILPDADFSASETSGEAPLTVKFTDESTESPTEWKWDFGDGNVSTKQNPEHTYSTAGVYTVEETVTNEAGENTETKTEYITVTVPLQIPDADFSVSETSGEAPLTVKFTDKSTESPTEWKWDFGDGNISAKQNPEHTYSTAGVYTVEETVTNEADEDTETKTDYITVTTPEKIDSGSDTASSYPTKNEISTFVSGYQGVSDFIETVSENSKSDHPEWKWDIWKDQSGNRVISFYYYQSNSKGYESIYFDSEGNTISKKGLELTPVYSYPGA